MDNDGWIYNTPVHSDVEAKLRNLLLELRNNNRIVGIQVCAYKDGKVIIDTTAGELGENDPRPVQPDSLFPVFSVTKGITAGMLHWLVDNGKLKLDENVANIWPEFGSNGKDLIKVHHVLNHTSGLHNSMADVLKENQHQLSDWDKCLNRIATSVPETEPGQVQLYHYITFGWLCGGIIEHASGKKFQEILEEAFIYPLQIEGELYIGIPPGVESRLATLTVDTDDLEMFSGTSLVSLPSTFQTGIISQLMPTLVALCNSLNNRRAIMPAANGHCSARALARYYAALVDSGVVPPPHSSSSKPPLGSHPHIPESSSEKSPKDNEQNQNYSTDIESGCHSSNTTKLADDTSTKIFRNSSRIHDAFLGAGEYENLAVHDGIFGLGFKRYSSEDGSFIGFGHSGMGGSTGFCVAEHRFAIAVILNKLSFGDLTAKIIQLVCSELNIPTPEDYRRFLEMGKPLIN
ncbi:hypothetical protein FNV43_RR04532 [Rhamnella rubrinervis]|uniref:Beta-lactamase-related domain-containing protein n=1 Tax=Rhamnella rubrinervis TaxID=2594499 RepID=A0A8K0MQP3_9ROSA|nr:hypothetical protein FNV43_RR04532 [Rhamnella rubrinervis]